MYFLLQTACDSAKQQPLLRPLINGNGRYELRSVVEVYEYKDVC